MGGFAQQRQVNAEQTSTSETLSVSQEKSTTEQTNTFEKTNIPLQQPTPDNSNSLQQQLAAEVITLSEYIGSLEEVETGQTITPETLNESQQRQVTEQTKGSENFAQQQRIGPEQTNTVEITNISTSDNNSPLQEQLSAEKITPQENREAVYQEVAIRQEELLENLNALHQQIVAKEKSLSANLEISQQQVEAGPSEKTHTTEEIVAAERRLQEQNEKTLAFAREVFDAYDSKIDVLEGLDELKLWNVKDHIAYKVKHWEQEHKTQLSLPNTIYTRTYPFQRSKIELENRLKPLEVMKKDIDDALDKISRITSVIKDVNEVRKGISKMDNHAKAGFMDYFIKQIDFYQENNQKRLDLQKHAWTQLERIEPHIAKATTELAVVMEKYGELEQQKLELQKPNRHPFFSDNDMALVVGDKTKTNIPFVEQVEFPGGGLVHMANTLLRARGIFINEQLIAQALGLHPLGGGINVDDLPDKLSALAGDKGDYFKGFRRFKIAQPRHLDKALSDGPIGAIISNATFGNHPVVLERPASDNPLQPDYRLQEIIVHDLFEPGGPYSISITKFNTVWTRTVFLSNEASQNYLAVTPNEEFDPTQVY